MHPLGQCHKRTTHWGALRCCLALALVCAIGAARATHEPSRAVVVVAGQPLGSGPDSPEGASRPKRQSGPSDEDALREIQPQAAAQQQASASRSQQQESRGKRTLYACEEKQLEIECQLGESIQLIRANYGRFSIQICNEQGQLDWKVNCMSPESYEIIARSCQAQQSCQLLASNKIFGDACPGTQKYLEVHYQCVPSTTNRTLQNDLQAPMQIQLPKGQNKLTPPMIKATGNNVIQHETTTLGSNSESGTSSQPIVKRPHWVMPNALQQQQQQQPTQSTSQVTAQLPNWMIDVPLNPNHGGIIPSTTPTIMSSTTIISSGPSTTRPSGTSGLLRCPEIVWRGIRWPTTEAGLMAQMACPPHASSTVAPYAATLMCHANGQWAGQMQAGRCQSFWLRNLTQRLEAGDSPLSILSELVLRTQQQQQSGQHGSSGGMGFWSSQIPASAAASLTSSPASYAGQHQLALFGDDLVQIGRIVGRLVEEMGEQLARISDDKQRISFARAMIQFFVDLVSNLAGGSQHTDAWLDLASATGERQRVAGQLVTGLENACVLLAGAQQQSVSGGPVDPQNGNEDFHKVTDHAYVAIQTFALDSKQQQQLANGSPASYIQKFQVTFPSQTNLLGTRWMNSDQRFTLNLQASNSLELDQQTGQPSLGQQQLKIVSVMLRGLGAKMSPIAQGQQQSGDKLSTSGDINMPTGQQQRSLVVNSDLVSFSIVADSTRSPIKVDLSAPIELVFRHNDHQQQHSLNGYVNRQQDQQTPTTVNSGSLGSRPTAYCVYWDASTSDWLPDGCKLVATNRTHSVCACNHLTTFALLSELDQTLGATTTSVNEQQHFHHEDGRRPPRVNLDNVGQELILVQPMATNSASFDGQLEGAATTIKSIYMAKLLEGNLFTNQQGTRTFLYVSCCLSAVLLAMLLAAAAYNRAHARRLLGSMPAEPPPSLLVANYHNNANSMQQEPQSLNGRQVPPLIETTTTTTASNTTRTSPPTSYSSNGMGDLMVKQDAATILGQEDEMNGFYSLIGGPNQYGPTGQAQVPSVLAHGPSYHHLVTGAQTSAPSKNPTGFSQMALVPIHLIVQLLLLQLLLVLLMESQNYLVWNSQQAKRMFLQDPNLSILGSTFGPMESNQDTLASTILNPIGTVTWLIVFALYYLVSTLVCWILAKLIQLNGHLAKLNRKFALAPGKDGQRQYTGHQHQPIAMISGSIYQQHHQQLPTNRYGQCQLHNSQQQGQPSSSPTLSTFSSSLAADVNQQQQQQQDRFYSGQPQLNKLIAAQKDSVYARHLQSNQPASHFLVRAFTSKHLAAALTHLGPIFLSTFLVWLTYDRAQLVNQLAYTTSTSSQLAYWPLAVNSGWNFPLVVLLYCLPSICLALGVLALVSLRRHFRQIYGPTANLLAHEEFHNQALNKHLHLGADSGGKRRQLKASPGASVSPSARLAIELGFESKRAKFVCLTLLALLALNSICWISFFIHCHKALTQATAATIQQQQQYASASTASGGEGIGNHLILAFASSNLLISLLICCSQRGQLRRAGQMLGLSRFMLSVSKNCCQIGDATKCSPASSSSVSSSSYYGQQHGQQQQQNPDAVQQQQLQFSHHHPQQHQHYGTGKSIKISSAPSQQSLFVISRSRPVGELGQQNYASGNAGGVSYGVHQQAPQYPPLHPQHHLYQQLAADSQQHIYDSTTNLNGGELVDQQRQEQLNALHLMGHQHPLQHRGGGGANNQHLPLQQQQQQPMINYTLGRSYNVANVTGPHFNLNHHHHQQQQHINGVGPNLTLKPTMLAGLGQQQQQGGMFASPHHHNQQQAASRAINGASSSGNPHDLLMCPISSNKTHSASSSGRLQLQQQQQQLSTPSSGSSSGEADGPLVALAKTTTSSSNNNNEHQFSIATNQSTPATFGPNQHNRSSSSNNNNKFPQATEHRQSNNDQSFALIGHGGVSGSANTGDQLAPSETLGTKPIKHGSQQHYGHNQVSSGQNYTEALKAAMAQEANQQQQQQQNFRRTNSAAMRQQQRSFASSSSSSASSSGGVPMMIDAHHQHHAANGANSGNFGDILAVNAHASSRSPPMVENRSNVYDVANCGASLRPGR